RSDVRVERAALLAKRPVVDKTIANVGIENPVERTCELRLRGGRRHAQGDGGECHCCGAEAEQPSAASGITGHDRRPPRKSSSAALKAAGCSRFERWPAPGMTCCCAPGIASARRSAT